MTPNVLFKCEYFQTGRKGYSFYSSKDTSNDYLSYVNNGVRQGKYRDYIDYAGNEEKSSGAFSANGILTPKEKEEIRDKLKSTKAQIWSCLISFEEEYGKKHMKSYLDAKELIEEEFPKFLKENRIEFSNITWFAGLHENTDNRHIHICFFENEPLRIIANKKERIFHHGKLKEESINKLKVRIEQRMSNIEYDIKSSRNKIISSTDEYLDSIVDPNVSFNKELKEKLLKLYRKIPDGNYGYESKKLDAVRNDVDDITSHYLFSDSSAKLEYISFLRKLSEYDKRTKEICVSQKISPDVFLLTNKFKKDIYRRIGNKVIGYVRSSKGKGNLFPPSFDTKKAGRLNEKKRINYLLKKSAYLSIAVSKERMDIFDEFERKMKEYEIEKEEKEM